MHVPFVNHWKVAVPVGVPPLPDTSAWSCTVDPTATVVTVPCSALWIAVSVDDGFLQSVGLLAVYGGPSVGYDAFGLPHGP